MWSRRLAQTTLQRTPSCRSGSTRTGRCLDHRGWLRWPYNFVCLHCAGTVSWRTAGSRWHCANCDCRVSATQLHREMQLGTILTARVMLHRYRSVTVRPGRDRLHDNAEVDESYLGGPEPGVHGRRALGKVLFGAAG